MANNESRLNTTVNKVFDYMDWFKAYDKASTDVQRKLLCLKHSNEISGQLLEAKKKCETYFEEVVDQPIYMTQDYLRMRKFLIHWYAAYNCIAREEQQVSDINFVDKGLLLQSLGYTLYSEHGEFHQKTLCTQLSDMYAEKGSPLCIAKMLSLLDISNFTIFEYWLERDPSDNQLIFKPVALDDISYNTGLAMQAKSVKPFQAVTEDDCHWQLKEEDIEAAEASGEMGLPSMTPYIGVISANDWVKHSKMVMAFMNRVVTDTYNKILNQPGYTVAEARKYYFYMTGDNISIIELYLGIGYIYNIIFNRTHEPARNNIDQRVPHYNGDESTILSEIQYVTEFNEVHRRSYDRDEKDQILRNVQSGWQTLNPITCWTHAELVNVFEQVSPDFKALVDNMIAGDQGYTMLKELLLMLDYFVKHDIGLTSYTSLFMLYDPLEEYKDKLKKVLNFFKPYQTRLIEAASYLIIDDLPGDCMATKELFRQRIFDKHFDEYNYLKDHLKQRIFDKHHDFIDRPEFDNVIGDMLNQIIMDKHFDTLMECDDKIFKIRIGDVFVEIYTLYRDAVKFAFGVRLPGSRLGFNSPSPSSTKPLPSGMVHIVNAFEMYEKSFDNYSQTTKSIMHTLLKSLFVEWYVVHKDVFKEPAVTERIKDERMFNSFIANMFNQSEKHHDILYAKTKVDFDINMLLADWQVIYKDKLIEPSITERVKDERMFNSFIADMFNHLEKVYDASSIEFLRRHTDRILAVDYAVVHRDSLSIIVNEYSDINFTQDSWRMVGDENVLTFDQLYDPNIPNVMSSIRSSNGRTTGLVEQYGPTDLSFKSSTTFAGKVVFFTIDTSINIAYADWVYSNVNNVYEYFIDPASYALNPNNKHMLKVLDSESVTASVSIQHHTDGSITLSTGIPFDAKVLVIVGEHASPFNSTTDWIVNGSQYRLVIDPSIFGYDQASTEYMVSIRDINGNEIVMDVKYDYSGVIILTSSFKTSGNFVITK